MIKKPTDMSNRYLEIKRKNIMILVFCKLAQQHLPKTIVNVFGVVDISPVCKIFH